MFALVAPSRLRKVHLSSADFLPLVYISHLAKDNNNNMNFTTFSRRLSTSLKPKLRFDGQTAIVTGAARGLGKEHARLLASRGANVIVNDFGGTRSGHDDQDGRKLAEQVVEEIAESCGGKCLASFDSIASPEGASRVVDLAVKQFGRVDILINNAGNLRDKSFAKMSIDDWDEVHNVHLRGSFLMSKACWPIMRQQDYGRIVMTSSTSGLYGNFGQANYAAAKMGLIGLSNVLAIEGAKNNIKCNVIVPLAASRMTLDVLPEEFAAKLKPELVGPLVAFLCHSSCTDSGSILEAAGGWFGKYKLLRSSGSYINLTGSCEEESVEKIAEKWTQICSLDQAMQVESFGEHLAELVKVLESKAE